MLILKKYFDNLSVDNANIGDDFGVSTDFFVFPCLQSSNSPTLNVIRDMIG